jgi:hypothetical protein
MKNKSRVIFAVALLLVMLVSVSCKKSERQKAELTLNFQTEVSGTDYSFANDFTNGDGTKIRLELLRFYISDVRFVSKKKSEEVVVTDIALLEFDLAGSGQAAIKIPAGDYTAIRFGLGVSPDLNETDPSAFNETGHPLNVTQNTYWGMNGLYKFVMLDGRSDADGDGTFEGIFSYHTGYNECYREVEIVHDFSIDRKGVYEQRIGIDVSKLFYVSGSMIDVTTESNYHGNLAEIDLAKRLSSNFASALVIH